MNPLKTAVAFYWLMLAALTARLPKTMARRGISALVAAIVIIVIIGIGGALVYLLVVSPGGTTTVYP